MRLLILLITCGLLTACGTTRTVTADTDIVDQLADRGYSAGRKATLASSSATWEIDGVRVDLEAITPTGAGPLPLVLYLPGLGESAAAGRAWRTAWAQAGYAVVSVQPLPSDVNAWSSPLARAGEFQALARERFSARVMWTRMQFLQAALTEMNRRRDRQEQPWARFDPNRIAIAGFELGAYTAMVSAGETMSGGSSASGTPATPPLPALPVAVRAVIALSPYANTPAASLLPAASARTTPPAQTYAAVGVPVLSVTGLQDSDPLTLVRTPVARRRPFDNLPPGDKYLLMLNDISHDALAGPTVEQLAQVLADEPEDRDRNNSSGRRGGQRNGTRGLDAINRPVRTTMLTGVLVSPTTQALGIALIQGVSTAFLDTYVNRDERARAWLERDASRWLQGRGELSAR